MRGIFYEWRAYIYVHRKKEDREPSLSLIEVVSNALKSLLYGVCLLEVIPLLSFHCMPWLCLLIGDTNTLQDSTPLHWKLCRISMLAYSPMAMGILSGKYYLPGGGPSDARMNLYQGCRNEPKFSFLLCDFIGIK